MPRIERSPGRGPTIAVPRGVVTPRVCAGRAVRGRRKSESGVAGEAARAEREPPAETLESAEEVLEPEGAAKWGDKTLGDYLRTRGYSSLPSFPS